jgi:hypothetical protein
MKQILFHVHNEFIQRLDTHVEIIVGLTIYYYYYYM